MEKVTIIMLLAAIVLPTLSQAQTTNICDRTPKVRDEILQRLELEADDCATVDSGTLASVDVLTPAGLTALQAGDFDGLTGLQRLASQGGQLTALPVGVFDSLTSLQELRLDENRLTELPEGALDSLTSLQTLTLDENRLTELPEGVFDGLTSLSILDLRSNRLVGLSRNDPLFSRLPSGVDLQLGGQTEAPGQPEEPGTPEEPRTHSADLVGKVAALEARVAAQGATLEESIATLQETLEQRMATLEAAVDDAPSNRLLIVPLEQTGGAQTEIH